MSAQVDPGAGGVVWRRRRLRWHIALVERRPRNGEPAEWSLPKGHIEPPETPKDAALREVAEEVGWRAAIVRELEPLRYKPTGPERRIRMWEMRAVSKISGGSAEENPAGEQILAADWVRPEHAIARLTHDEQARFLAASLPGQNAGRRRPLWWGYARRRERLRASLDVYEAELRSRSDPTTIALELIGDARRQVATRGDIDTGWMFLVAAQRQEILTMDPSEVASRRQALVAETDAKLQNSWRGTAIRKLLVAEERDADQDAPQEQDEKRRLAEATRLRDEYSDNVYRRLAHTREQLTILGVIAFVVTTALLALLTTSAIPSSGTPEQPLAFLGVALFGALGGAFSGAISLMRAIDTTRTTIPQVLSSGFTTIMRPVVGTVGAIAAYTFLGAGLFTGVDVEGGYAVAFAAGFSERLVSRVAESLNP